MIVAAALQNPFGHGIGLVCDLSQLAYSGGDRLLQWRDIPPLRHTPHYSLGVVSSEENRASIQSLILENGDHELETNHFSSLNKAVSTLIRGPGDRN